MENCLLIRCYCRTSAMSPSRSSESDEDYRPDMEEEALSNVFGNTPVKNDGLGNSSDAPSPKRLAWQCLAIIFHMTLDQSPTVAFHLHCPFVYILSRYRLLAKDIRLEQCSFVHLLID